jgi:hypothetical protein
MNKTDHFIKRQHQRAISDDLLKIVEEYGTYSNAKGGAIEIHLGNREYQNIVNKTKRFLHTLDRARGSTIIVCGNEMLTVYKKH